MDSILEQLLIVAISALFGAFFGWRAYRAQAKNEYKFALLEKFNSKEYLEYRRCADKFLEENINNLTLETLINYEGDKESKFALSMVISFFVVISKDLESKYIQKSIYKKYFKDTFDWWYDEYLKEFRKDFDEMKPEKKRKIILDGL